MLEIRCRVLTQSEYEEWYRLCLCRDFPVNEIKPLEDIIAMSDEGRYAVLVYEKVGEPAGAEGSCGSGGAGAYLGYATIWKRRGVGTYLLDYLGVSEKMRNLGVGREILGRVRNDVEKAEGCKDLYLVLESETPQLSNDSDENMIKRRRLNFYKRNGWVPMYEMATCGVRFTAMSFERVPDDVERVMAEHKKIYGKLRDDVIIPLPPDMEPPLPYWMRRV